MEAALQVAALYFVSTLPLDPLVDHALWWGFCAVVAGTALGYTWVLWRILAAADKRLLVYFPPLRSGAWGAAPPRVADAERDPSEAIITTNLEYDVRRLAWVCATAALSAGALLFVGSLFSTRTTIAVAVVMGPFNFVSEPLVALHLLGGKEARRPFVPKASSWLALVGGPPPVVGGPLAVGGPPETAPAAPAASGRGAGPGGGPAATSGVGPKGGTARRR